MRRARLEYVGGRGNRVREYAADDGLGVAAPGALGELVAGVGGGCGGGFGDAAAEAGGGGDGEMWAESMAGGTSVSVGTRTGAVRPCVLCAMCSCGLSLVTSRE